MKNLVVFVSGSGTNMENLARYFAASTVARVRLVVCNNPAAGAIARAERLGIPVLMITRADFAQPDLLIEKLRTQQADMLILAGFLWLLPPGLIRAFSGKIVNIHPALLPAYGGKGMYGMRVHEAVIAAGEKQSGITIHYVNEQYDQGEIIFQASLEIPPEESPESLARRIHELEYQYFPRVVESLLTGK
ncbi:MAG: phosphoribosylglycinamide formyltransferase [Bacteroidetes bacterium]|nr:phosphoribosylglycinamide formyltransferase [Bacteroidota bacterium]